MATEFQQQVWDALNKIPQGRVTTYALLARHIGRPRSVRAVGTACGANPHLVSTPCHRVVTSSGAVGHYVQGTEAKKRLLEQEGVEIEQDRVKNFAEKTYTFD